MLDVVINGALMGLVYGAMALGLGLITGVVKFVNFAHGDFLTVGAYLSAALFALAVPPAVTLFIALPAIVVLGLVSYWGIARPVIRSNPTAQLVATLGMGLIIQSVVLIIFSATQIRVIDPMFDQVWGLGSVYVSSARFYTAALSVLLAVITWLFLHKTDWGKIVRAVADDVHAAECSGVNVQRAYFIAWTFALGLTTLAGVILVTFYPASPLLSWDFIIPMFLVLVLGGLDNILGIMISGVLVGVYASLFGYFLSVNLAQVGLFLAFIVVLLVRPQGLFGRRARIV